MKVGSTVKVIGYEEYGLGVVGDILENDVYPIYVEFINKELHESENSGYFENDLIVEV